MVQLSVTTVYQMWVITWSINLAAGSSIYKSLVKTIYSSIHSIQCSIMALLSKSVGDCSLCIYYSVHAHTETKSCVAPLFLSENHVLHFIKIYTQEGNGQQRWT